MYIRAVESLAQGPFANMAMGNYPYPSTYLMHGHSFLPAWPMRKGDTHESRTVRCAPTVPMRVLQ